MAFIQSVGASDTGGGGSLQTAAFASSPTTGNAILVAIQTSHASPSVTSVTDTQSNTYSKAIAQNRGNSALGNVEIWYSTGITGGATFKVTANVAGGTTLNMIAQEYSGIATSSALDKTHGGNATNSSAVTSGSTVTTTQASETLFGAMGTTDPHTITVGSGYSNLTTQKSGGNGMDCACENESVASTGAYAATFTIDANDDWAAVIATFKNAGGAETITVDKWYQPTQQPYNDPLGITPY